MPVKWQSPDDVNDLPPIISDWLLNTGSLTERLQALTHRFEVHLLGQEIAAMDSTEQRLLDIHSQEQWQIREVILQGTPLIDTSTPQSKLINNATQPLQDWVFARSVLPHSLCQSALANLGSQPLGSRIFNDHNFVRSGFEIGKLYHHPVNHKVFDEQAPCWARRSKFTIGQYQLIVAEAFLPQSPCYWP